MSAANRAVFVFSMILLAIGLFWGISSVMSANEVESKIDDVILDERKVKTLEAMLKAEPPSTMLDRWSEVNESMVAEWKEDDSLKYRRLADSYRFYSWIAIGIAGAGLAGIIGAFTLKGSGPKRR